jgi:hypothetical protein
LAETLRLMRLQQPSKIERLVGREAITVAARDRAAAREAVFRVVHVGPGVTHPDNHVAKRRINQSGSSSLNLATLTVIPLLAVFQVSASGGPGAPS